MPMRLYHSRVRPYPSIRKTVKWGGVVVCVLLALVWVGSGWWCLELESPAGGGLFVQGGRFAVLTPLFATGAKGEWVCWFEPLPVPFHWWFSVGTWNLGWDVAVPLWVPVAAVLVATVIAWRLDGTGRRRARMGACLKCGYGRAGLASGAVCPECGKAE